MNTRRDAKMTWRNRRSMVPIAGALALSLLSGSPAAMAQFDLSSLAAMAQGQAGKPGDQGQPEMRDPLGAKAGGEIDGVKVNEHLMVDLHVQDEDLTSVLQMLSIQSQKNILTSKSVSASVTANLYGVTFYEALDAILNVNGYGYIESGNFIYVYTTEELVEMEKLSQVRVARVMKLNYLNGTDAAEFVKPLLSESGQIKTNGKTENFTIPDNAPVGGEDFALDSTLVVIDFEDNVNQIEMLIEQLDTKPSQVLVEATILQTALNEANAFGVDFTVLGSLDFVDFVGLGGPIKAADALISGKGSRLSGGSTSDVAVPASGRSASAISSSPGNTSGPGTMKVGLVSGDVAAFLRVLDEVTDTTILSRPNVLTLNRQPARVLVGRKVGYLNTTSTDTATTQTVEFLDTGTQLYFRPFVSSDGMIRMELKPQVSEAVIREATDATGAAVTIPDEITNELVTNVMVRDGQTIVLGGLFRESTQNTRRQVPFMGDIPVIGAAFRGHEDEVQRSEIIFMITPTIVNDAQLIDQATQATTYMDHVRSGAREGLLPFSRERQSATLLVQARKLAAEGKTEEALYAVQRSLAMSPSQPEAIALRAKLMQNEKVWPTRRLMDEIVRHEMKKAEATGPASPRSVDIPLEGEPTHEPAAPAQGQNAAGAQASATEPASGIEPGGIEPVGTDPAGNDPSPSTPPGDQAQGPSAPGVEATGAERNNQGPAITTGPARLGAAAPSDPTAPTAGAAESSTPVEKVDSSSDVPLTPDAQASTDLPVAVEEGSELAQAEPSESALASLAAAEPMTPIGWNATGLQGEAPRSVASAIGAGGSTFRDATTDPVVRALVESRQGGVEGSMTGSQGGGSQVASGREAQPASRSGDQFGPASQTTSVSASRSTSASPDSVGIDLDAEFDLRVASVLLKPIPWTWD